MGSSASRRKPKLIKLFCGMIGSREAILKGVESLGLLFGEVDSENKLIAFDFTDYYRAEMGVGLLRKWISFQTLRERAYLALAKHLGTRLEEELSIGGGRSVNIDPGYVDDAQVVLATAKNYSHRIYIGMGFYAEVSLIYKDKAFRALNWTYPDYQTTDALDFFEQARKAYLRQVRTGLET